MLLHRPEEIDTADTTTRSDNNAGARVKFAAVAGRVLDLLNDDKLLSPLDAAVIPLPHQIRALRRVVANPGKVRYLMADEVGLGKTIEAGLAIRELKLRGMIKRVLVVAPKGLIPQWIVEMRDRFGEDFRHFDPGQFDAYRQISQEENVWRSHDRVICSMDGVKPLDTRKGWDQERINAFNRDRILGLASAGWDMIVIDEAHRVAGSSDTVARHAMARMMAEAAPYLLLLSATPHQGKTDAFQRLMSLLDAEAFPDAASVSRDRVAPFIVRTEKRQAINHDGSALFKPRITKLVGVSWDGHEAQRELYDAVTEYVRQGYNQAMLEKKTYIGFLMVLMQRLVSSSTRAIAATLERRLAVLNEPTEQMEFFPEVAEWNEMDGQEQLDTVLRQRMKAMDNEKDEVRLLLDAARKVEANGPDAKARTLLEWIYRLQEEEQDPQLKVLIFTEFVPSQSMLAEFLQARGMSVVCLNGSMGLEERKTVQKRFLEDVRIMISTDAGGEGLNLQFCHVIINFDLGWRPMALEQRIGRLDRIGQKHIVKALNFLLEDSVEFRIQEVLEAKLQTILEEFGVDKTSDLLDSVEGNRMFDRLFIEALLHPERVNEEADIIADSLRKESDEHHHGRVLQADGEISGAEIGAISSQPVGDLLEMLVRFHVESSGGEFRRGSGGETLVRWPDEDQVEQVRFPGAREEADGILLTLDHPRIRGLLGRAPIHGKGEPIPRMNLAALPRTIDGFWSLWVLKMTSFDFRRAKVFPVFISRDGRTFAQTARHVWERLASLDVSQTGWITGTDAMAFHDHCYRAASEEGKSLWQEMERQHRQRWEDEKNRAQYHFIARRRMLGQVGLAEVRGYRLRQLEAEETARMAQIESQRILLPELEPLTILSIEPT
ncbi:MAG: DEAD/DEAH box helicase family protein [Akkermansiaceae bacterium]|nr:DEAD/DEAH box helicase family protein [Akkermansiaceae bacterium]